jgi:hypothetical protein
MSYTLQRIDPALAKEWHPKNNKPLTPNDVTPNSGKKVWWLCKHGHEWQAIINNRRKGTGCPYCSGRNASQDNNLSTLYPTIAKQWHPKKNGDLKPLDVKPGSHKKVWWSCPEGHEWESTVKNRVLGKGCPYCAGKLPTPKTNLAILFPEVSMEWHPTKNKNLIPRHYLPQSNKKVWWKCNRGHEWQARIQDRTTGKNSCPYCSHQTSQVEIRIYCELKNILPQVLWRRRINGIEIDVFLPEEKIAIEIDGYYWHRDRKKADWLKQEKIKNLGLRIIRVREKPLKKLSDNDSIFPSKYYDDKKVVDGLIKNLIPIVHQKHQTKLQSYLKGKGLINNKDFRKILSHLPGPSPENSLQSKFPQIAKEWNFVRNSPLLPVQFSPQSNKRMWWRCEIGHEWQALICSRVKGNNCPYCSGRFATPENNLQILKPDTAKEWHPSKNKKLKPEDVTPFSHKKVWWKCEKGHEWQAQISNRVNARGCPFCSGKRPSKEYNFKALHPSLALEWNKSKNGSLVPEEVTPGSGKKVWWQCSKRHEWIAAIYSRVAGNGCPYCAGRKK